VTPPPDLPEKDALIAALVARIEALVARIAELEAKLACAKTPDNSSVPPSKGQKPSEPSAPKGKAKPHVGAHRRFMPTQLPGAMSSPARAKAAAPTYPASRKARAKPMTASKS